MNELLSLEPRVAGEDVAEPETDLTHRSDDEHMRCVCYFTECATGDIGGTNGGGGGG
jgi:hypothetical protein